MHCGTCYKKFSLMRTRKQCSECRRYYCKYCVMRKANKHINCENCAVLTSRPLNKTQLLKLKAKDLQVYLANKQVSTKGCIEKEDLVNLLLVYANGTTETTPSETTNYSTDDQTNPTRQLFKNLRSFFTSTSDVQSNSRSNSEPSNPTTTAGSRVHYHSRPPYYNPPPPPPPPNLETSDTTTTTPSTQDVPSLNVALVSSAEEAVAASDDDDVTGAAESTSILLPPLHSDTVQQQTNAGGQQSNSESESDSDIIVTTRSSNHSNLTATERDISNSNESFHNLQLSDIKRQKDLSDLTIQQLKCLLIKNRVDFKGCVEKAELLERVQRLWNEYSQSREGLETLPIDDLCKICMDAPIECVMLECGHMATCTLCGKQLSECPICRQYVVRVVRTFRA